MFPQFKDLRILNSIYHSNSFYAIIGTYLNLYFLAKPTAGCYCFVQKNVYVASYYFHCSLFIVTYLYFYVDSFFLHLYSFEEFYLSELQRMNILFSYVWMYLCFVIIFLEHFHCR